MNICEPCQGGNTAALSRTVHVPQGCLAEFFREYRIEVSSQSHMPALFFTGENGHWDRCRIAMGCRLCPRNCGVTREQGDFGYCREGRILRVARAALHPFEEPCICAAPGSGAVFFSGCPLQCVFCQNHTISGTETASFGKEISTDRLTRIFLELQKKGACNINLVTPTHFVSQIIPALQNAKRNGLTIPVVYNTGGYEKSETLRSLEGLVDIYLPDFKYASSRLSARYSNAPDYFFHASAAIAEMYRQTGDPVFDRDSGLLQRGVMVRHMMLPGHLADSQRVLRYLFDTFGNQILYSIMNQYTPVRHFSELPRLNRRVSHKEYNALMQFCLALGIENGFFQEGEAAAESFIPVFDGEGV